MPPRTPATPTPARTPRARRPSAATPSRPSRGAHAFDARAVPPWRRLDASASATSREFERLASLALESRDVAPADASRRATSRTARASNALRAATLAATELRPMLDPVSASAQISALLAFIAAHERLPAPADQAWYGPHLRARAAVLAALESLREAHRLRTTMRRSAAGSRQHRAPLDRGADVLAAHGHRRLILLDAPSAAYADLDELRLVGPGRVRLARAQRAAASSIRRRCWRSLAGRRTPTVSRPRAPGFTICCAWRGAGLGLHLHAGRRCDRPGVAVARGDRHRGSADRATCPPDDGARMFLHEALSEEPIAARALSGAPLEWLALRHRAAGLRRTVSRRRLVRAGRRYAVSASSAISMPVQVLRGARAGACRKSATRSPG